MTAQKEVKYPQIIFNDDMAVLECICEMTDKNIIHALQRFIDDARDKPGLLLYRSTRDEKILLFLYKSALSFGDTDNALVLYIDKSLAHLSGYFNKQLINTSSDTGELFTQLKDIARYLIFTIEEAEAENTQTNFMG